METMKRIGSILIGTATETFEYIIAALCMADIAAVLVAAGIRTLFVREKE